MKTTSRKRPKRVLTGVVLTENDAAIIDRLTQDASDLAGWTISASAIIRGLLRLADQQGPGWAREHLQPIIEAETSRGLTWGGSRKGAGRKKEAALPLLGVNKLAETRQRV